jgi:hypothetical protein
LDAVRARLTTLVGEGLPALIVDPRAEFVIRAFLGAYCYEQYSDGTFSRDPCKQGTQGHASHTMDALAYVATRLFSRPPARDDDEDAPLRRPAVSSQASGFWRR